MKVYDFNKVGYASLPDLTREEEKKATKLIQDYIMTKNNSYYILLNHELRYFTTFKTVSFAPKSAEEILTFLKELGNIKSIEVSESGDMIECWIIYNKECHMFGFLAYDWGIVNV